MNIFWNWLKDPGTQAMLVLFGTGFAFVAALCAFYFGRKSLTKRDLTPLEQNTAATSGHLENVHTHLASLNERARRQEDAGNLANRAAFVSVSVRGEVDAGKPMSVYLTAKEPTIHFTRVEFRSEQGSPFGQSECIATGNLFEFVARLPSDNLNRWRMGGASINVDATRHTLRVWMCLDDHSYEVHRDIGVTLTGGLRGGGKDAPGINVATYKLEGTV
jgi:hypothetical protein